MKTLEERQVEALERIAASLSRIVADVTGPLGCFVWLAFGAGVTWLLNR